MPKAQAKINGCISIEPCSSLLTLAAMVSLLFQNGDTKYHVLVSQKSTRFVLSTRFYRLLSGRDRLDVFYQLDFQDDPLDSRPLGEKASFEGGLISRLYSCNKGARLRQGALRLLRPHARLQQLRVAQMGTF